MTNKFFLIALSLFSLSAVMPSMVLADPLNPSTFIDTSSGFGIGNGAVSTGHQIFRFNATEGDLITIGVFVTAILPGNQFEDDDSQLFLFDKMGALVAENDDADPFETEFQSIIQDYLVPSSGVYYIGVTTFDNDPIIDVEALITGWEDDGESNIEFEVYVFGATAIPEPSAFLQTGIGLLGLTGFGWWHRRQKRSQE